MNRLNNESDNFLPISGSNAEKEEHLQLSCNNVENIKESVCHSVKCLKSEVGQCQDTVHNSANTNHVIHSNEDAIHSNTLSILKENQLTPSSIFNKPENALRDCNMKSLSDNETGLQRINTLSGNSSEFCVSCRFCKKVFKTLKKIKTHNCEKGKNNNTNANLHKCKFCFLTFSLKQHLNKHIKGHKRNNCTLCNAQFTNRKAICKHLRTEHNILEPEKLYNCSFCSKHFLKRRCLNIHLKSHSNNKFFCLTCGFMCDDENNFNDHEKIHRKKDSKFECHLCQRIFFRRQQYDQHIATHEKCVCFPCDIAFPNQKLFSKHQQSVHRSPNEKKHACPICKKLFVRPKHLEVHYRVHTGEKPYKCSQCEKNFYDNKGLLKHMKTVRHLQRANVDEGKVVEIEKPFLCSGCGIRFYRQHSLLRHIEIIHTTMESTKCPHCEYKTKCKANFKRHVELHTDTKRFICELCGSTFRAFATLKEHHAFVHSEDRGFICDVCNKGFKNKSTLSRHTRIHSANRPYKCHCNRDYKRLSHLKRHMISAHHVNSKKNNTSITEGNTNLDSQSTDKNLTALTESLEALPNESSCDDFSVPVSSNNQDLNIDEIMDNEQLSVQSESDSNTSTPLTQILSGNSDSHMLSDPENTLLTCDSTSCVAPLCVQLDSQASILLDDPKLSVSSGNYCNINVPPFSVSPVESISNLHQSQNILSPSSIDSLIRPHSLPNLNFQTSTLNSDSFASFSMHNLDVPTSAQIPYKSSMSDEALFSSSVSDLNLEQNSSTKELFSEAGDIFSLSSNSGLEANCSTKNFFYSTRDFEFWDTDDSSNTLKMSNIDLAATTEHTSLSTNLICNLSPRSLFPNDSLMSCALDESPEFDSLL